ncbi:sensor histidine kinase [Dyadobacter frigoris]|uniref:histidine kinase n=1 Tax=Dyadobacter frigoris TaxID=2576211 RepID=A0A4U6D5H9_9BACT|nr:HAMP domain-containing sensor histidine kinase [Dyadobacter frigoris]TKT92609.1 HAMP domain-containing histidine kinase [Dyadobacter frigoris]GLU51500.1 two-component sensor histidine kinase [Dyadobacter frigoris]
MKIQHKLTLNSSLVFGLVFTIASVLIYLNFIRSAERIFFEDLARTASLTAMFYLEEDELSTKDYSRIEKKFLTASADQEIRLYDKTGMIHYGEADPDTNITSKILKTIRAKNRYNFKVDNAFYYAIYYRDNQGSFSIIIKAKNPVLEAQENELIRILLIALVIGVAVIVALSYSLSRIAYSPVRHIIEQVKTIDMTGQKHTLTYRQTKDELEDLFKEFNWMLEKVYQNIQIQKNFINHASHELKSPLASIVGNLEVLLQKDREIQEYKNIGQNVLNDAGRLEKILQNLLVLAGLDQNYNEKTSEERIDEILWEVLDTLASDYKKTKINLHWNLPQDHTELLEYRCVSTQIYIALYNLIENAAKFSSGKPVNITVENQSGHLLIQIEDKGIGINPNDLDHIKEPFYRGVNAVRTKGNGLGMTIAGKILENHGIGISIDSKVGSGTRIGLLFS